VAEILSRFCRPGLDSGRGVRHAEEARTGGVNLILYLVESLMDPADLGFHFTSEPIPNLRALRKTHIGGYAVVPEEFGGSPSTEFETLTGMSTAFLPEGSVAYRLYLKHPIPSLPRTLGELGYATTVVRADPKYFYNHEAAFRLLGFDKVAWLHESPAVEHDPRTEWPSDEAIVQAIIQAAEEAHPFFVLAFASSTHSPYNHGTYRDSDLDVRDAPTREAADKVKEYINAVRVADHAIGTLVEYARRRPDSTIIAVLGDHLPPLPNDPLRSFLLRSSAMSKPEAAWLRRRVPLLVWANFDFPREEKELGTHALPSYLLQKMNLPRTGFLAASEEVGRRLSIVRGYAKAGDGTIWSWDSLPVTERNLLADYRLLQYDLLLGKRYALRDSISEAGSCSRVLRSP
jgi:phosphoglycerol transferase MdoB-like AlkP superfamily enzyme